MEEEITYTVPPNTKFNIKGKMTIVHFILLVLIIGPLVYLAIDWINRQDLPFIEITVFYFFIIPILFVWFRKKRLFEIKYILNKEGVTITRGNNRKFYSWKDFKCYSLTGNILKDKLTDYLGFLLPERDEYIIYLFPHHKESLSLVGHDDPDDAIKIYTMPENYYQTEKYISNLLPSGPVYSSTMAVKSKMRPKSKTIRILLYILAGIFFLIGIGAIVYATLIFYGIIEIK